MKTSKWFWFFLVLLLGVINCFGFTLGTFAYLSNKSNMSSIVRPCAQKMRELYYNAALVELFPISESGDTNIQTSLYEKINYSNDASRIKLAIEDKRFGADDPTSSSYAYSTGCYYKFEAEFSDSLSVLGNDATNDSYWYGSRETRVMNNGSATIKKRIGELASPTEFPQGTSHGLWKCERDSIYNGQSEGFAYGDLRYRSKIPPDQDEQTRTWKDIRIGKEFRIKRLFDADADSLYIRYCFKLANQAQADTLLTFSVVGYPYDGNGGHNSNPTDVQFYFGDTTTTSFEMNYTDYLNLPSDLNNWKYFDISIPYRTLITNNLLVEGQNQWTYTLANINPRVYWHGNNTLFLDYIEIRDQQYKNIEDNDNQYAQSIQTAIQQYPSGDLAYVMSLDEPYPPHYTSYYNLQNILHNHNVKQIAAVNMRNFRLFPKYGTTVTYQNNLQGFINEAQPINVMTNPYLVTDQILWDDNVSDPNHLQRMIDEFVLDPYIIAKNRSLATGGDFIATLQTMGRWDPSQSKWVQYQLPPARTQQMMQYLPLCVGADGIFNYRLWGTDPTTSQSYKEYAPLLVNLGNSTVDKVPEVFNSLKDANRKTLFYGNLLDDMTWLGTNTTTESFSTPSSFPSQVQISDIVPSSPAGNYPYGCFVQSGSYLDADGIPALVLVNRRSNFFERSTAAIDEASKVPLDQYDDYLPEFNNQSLDIHIQPTVATLLGDNVGLYDPFDGSFYRQTIGSQNEGIVNLDIEPGDAKLLLMRGYLPENVSGIVELVYKSVIYDSVFVASDGQVTSPQDSELAILPNSHITLSSGSQMHLSGNIVFRDNSCFTIESGAVLDISQATCTFEGRVLFEGQGNVVVADSTRCIYNEGAEVVFSNHIHAELSGDHDLLEGVRIECNTNAVVLFQNCTIEKSRTGCIIATSSCITFNSVTMSSEINSFIYSDSGIFIEDNSSISVISSSLLYTVIRVTNSNFLSENSDYLMKRGYPNNPSIGVIINNSYSPHSIDIINSEIGHGFREANPILNNHRAQGIQISSSTAPITVENCIFSDLKIGISKTDGTEYLNSISHCEFIRCETGISYDGANINDRIEFCSFTNCDKGINLLGTVPNVNSCTFNACTNGIFLEDTIYLGSQSGIFNSDFTQCRTAIESRGANQRVESCTFNLNNTGLLCHQDSNLNLSYNASNSFRNTEANIKFPEDSLYTAYIQLTEGHNDFWHFNGPNPATTTYDFYFGDNYSSSTGNAIDASKNWFEVDTVTLNDSTYVDYVKVDGFDSDPNTDGTDPDGSNRYLMALHAESIGQFSAASSLYELILNEELESEKDYLGGCLDGLYRTAMLDEIQAAYLQNYLGSLEYQYTPVDSAFCQLISNYYVKACVANGDYQTAIDILQLRIDNSISDVDSLRAVLDLEIVLQLESIKEAKKPIILKYKQFKYPSVAVFYRNHEEHISQYRDAITQGGNQEYPVIPPAPIISSNYPNPFNPSTTITFSLPDAAKAKLTVFNLRGQHVRTLVNSDLPRGLHKFIWDGVDDNQRSVSSGVYFFRLEAGGKQSIRKSLLLK
ncbi:MAG TPA: FlgD immunoglobulin-like domain containing protein [Candidatus Cloacimonadota bacterium]|nr:FlgD immunoglobulin-like domain containing protein [Candidatus Cloacimonadota bacterium]